MRFRRVLGETFWILVLSVIVLFGFFVALGAFSPAEVAGLSVFVGVLVLLWITHAVWEGRRRDARDPRAVAARERRGF